MARFCWRERTERVNWRMLKNLQLSEVVRRGDATLLEPYTLHLTFAKLPVVVTSLRPSKSDIYEDTMEPTSSTGGRNAWFLVRVFQLAMEYLLFLRARDGTVLDSLREELLASEKESELLMERAKKWKERARSSDRQTEKLHHVLQGIAKLLQIEGATPTAITTIEGLLRDLVVPRGPTKREAPERETHVEEARVCALCGKMFSSQEFLEKHTVRRHAGQEPRAVQTEKKPSRQAWTHPSTNNNGGGEEAAGDQQPPASGMKEMLRTVEQTLFEHQAALRNVAQEEAEKIHSLYEQLHVETQLAEEMRAKRAAIEKHVEQSRRELDAILQEKADAVEEIRVMTEQLQFLEMKRKIQAQNGDVANAGTSNDADDTLQLELKRLESTISMLKDALATSREELQRTQQSYGALLKDKQRLKGQIPADPKRPPSPVIEAKHAPTTKDVGTQASVVSTSTLSQTNVVPAPQVPVVAVPKRVEAGDAAVQTELPAAHVDGVVQTDAMVVSVDEVVPPKPVPEPTKETAVDEPKVEDRSIDLESIFQLHCRSISDDIQRRALKFAHSKPSASGNNSNEKIFSSLARRQFLRSRFLHDESAVKEQIAVQITKLERTSQRYGVPPKSSVLANEHVEVVQRALHAHLEVLPAEVLQRMIDVENQVNEMIKSEWMPNEKSRQQALELLTANRAVKNQRNELLIQQAMGALGTNAASEAHEAVVAAAAPGSIKEEPLEPVDTKSSDEEGQQEPASFQLHTLEEKLQLIQVQDSNSALADAKLPVASVEAVVNLEVREVVAVVPEPRHSPNLQITIDPPYMDAVPEPHAVSYLVGEPSPETVQNVRRQSIAVRSVKTVSVSPRSSPPKASPPKSYLPKTSPPKISLPKDSPPNLSPRPSPREEKAEKASSQAERTPMLSTTSDDARRFGRDRDYDRRAPTERLSVVFSDVTSSEMSLDASIPSLATDATSEAGFSASQSFVKSSTEDLPALRDEDESPHPRHVQTMSLEGDNARREVSDAVPHATPIQARQEVSLFVADSHLNSPRAASPSNEIMAFDDSDIEEVVLS